MRPPESWKHGRATLVIAGATALAWLLASVTGIAQTAVIWAGFIPIRAAGATANMALAPVWLTPLTATFVHGGWVHLFMNLLIFLFCGRSVETILGIRGLLILYIVGAYAAAAAHYFVNPVETAPMVGASGAISAVIGAYAVMFGRNRVTVRNPLIAFWLNALWLAVAWVVLQALLGITFETAGARIAIAAHIGGFLIGLILAKPLLILRYRNA